MAASFRIRGGDKLMKHLKSLPAEATAETKALIKRQGEALTAEMKALAPVYRGPDPRPVPGALRDSIRARYSQKGLYVRVGIFGAQAARKAARAAVLTRKGVKRGRAKRLAEAAERDVFYARWIEFGTTKMRPQPFLYPTFRRRRAAFRGEIAGAVVKAIKRTTR